MAAVLWPSVLSLSVRRWLGISSRRVIAVWWETLQHVSPSLHLSLSLRCVEQCLWALFCSCEPVTVKASGGTFNKPVPLCMLEDATQAKAGYAESAAQHAVNPSSLICLCAIVCQNRSLAIGLLDSTAAALCRALWTVKSRCYANRAHLEHQWS